MIDESARTPPERSATRHAKSSETKAGSAMRLFESPETSLGTLSKETTAGLIAASSDVALVIDDNGIIVDVAFGSEDLAKDGGAHWIGQSFSETVTVESRPKVEALLREAGPANGTQHVRWRHLNHTTTRGTDLPIMYSAVQLNAAERTSSRGRSVAFGRDLRGTVALQQRLVDAQRSMERDYWRFRHAETRYRHLFHVATESVLIVEAASLKVIEANPAATKLFGDKGPKLVGNPLAQCFDPADAEAVLVLLSGVRAAGRAEDIHVQLPESAGVDATELVVSATTFKQDSLSFFVVRLAPSRPGTSSLQPASTQEMMIRMLGSAPDCQVITNLDGQVIWANASFLELTQLTTEEQVRGQSLDRWLGRTGVDLSVLISNLRQRNQVRLFATTLRGEYGATTEAEISAVMLSHGDQAFLGFSVRDVGRRLSTDPRATKELPRSVGQLTELVGRVPLKEIVDETTDLIEQLCIEAALELTRDNRASAAEMLGLSRQSLYVKLRRFGLGAPGPETDKSSA
jgi:transcriptional regulator PpsR